MVLVTRAYWTRIALGFIRKSQFYRRPTTWTQLATSPIVNSVNKFKNSLYFGSDRTIIRLSKVQKMIFSDKALCKNYQAPILLERLQVFRVPSNRWCTSILVDFEAGPLSSAMQLYSLIRWKLQTKKKNTEFFETYLTGTIPVWDVANLTTILNTLKLWLVEVWTFGNEWNYRKYNSLD